jgi:lipopolysaccharide/colanic/teichoic acid biosynthesis glycosyltransferase
MDELPGLWNVIKGDMSLIGPRPLPLEYRAYYTVEQSKRLEVKPGVAGYAALFGRNAQSWESIFERDVWYVHHISFLLDLKIIVGILGVVLSRKGIDRGGHNRDSEFQRRIESASRE